MNNTYLLGIDLGTSSTKTAIIDHNGRLISLAVEEYAFQIPKPGWAEMNPQIWFEAAIHTIRKAITESNLDSRQIVGIGVTGMMHGPVFLDANGRSIRPSIIWADQRSDKQVLHVHQTLGREIIARRIGNPVATGFLLPTLLWMKENEPDQLDQTHLLLLPKDYLRYCFTGELGTEHSDASATSLYNPFDEDWSTDIISTFSIPSVLLPRIYPSHQVAGVLRTKVADLTKLQAGTPVVFGGSDQACQAIGNGITKPGLVSSTIGTGGQLFTVIQEPIFDPGLRIHLFHHAIADTWHLLAATLTAGKSLRWLRDQILPGSNYQDLVNEATKTLPGADGLIFLPYLAGERTPYMDPTATASFFGLSLRHTRAHLVRAVLEGVVMSLKQGLEIFLAMGVEVHRMIASGGAINNPLWLQLQADIFNQTIYQTQTREAAAVGAALLAGVGVGVYNSLNEACQAAVQWKGKVAEPELQNREIYEEKYQTFKTLFPLMRNVNKKIDDNWMK